MRKADIKADMKADIKADIKADMKADIKADMKADIKAERIDRYDSYYYARPGRELHLPVWRVTFGDSARSAVYLHTVTGEPVGFVDRDTRRWRWWRDGMHSWDFPGINGRRPLWDALVLPFMLGGLLSAATGVWLAIRRVRRLV
jgi:hypothetical protein